MNTERELLLEILHHNVQATHPSRGKENAKLIRKVCEAIGVDEDEFLPRHVKRDKRAWGLS